MPNALILATSSSAMPAKPNTKAKEQGDSKDGAAFQDVMDLEAHAAESGDEAELQTSEEPEELAHDPEIAPAETNKIATDLGIETPTINQATTNPETTVEGTALPAQADPYVPASSDIPHSNVSAPVIGAMVSKAPLVDSSSLPQASMGTKPDRTAQPEAIPPTSGPAEQTAVVSKFAPRLAHTAQMNVEKPPKRADDAATQKSEPAPIKGVQARSVPTDRAASLAQMQIMASARVAPEDVAAKSDGIEEISTTRESPLFQTTRETAQGVIPAQTAAKAEIARAIASQMAAAVNSRPGSGAVEITLNPEELGRVSIVLNGREDGLQMTIAAERPETLELMRRHIAVLTSEFQKLGYGDLSLDLGTSSDAQRDDANPNAQSGFEADHTGDDIQTAPVIQPTALGRGIDMRL